jgi:predicted small secreted protein
MKKKAFILGILIAFATAPQALSPILKTEIKSENKIEKTKATMKEKRDRKSVV